MCNPNRAPSRLCSGRLLRPALFLLTFFLSSAVGAQTLRIAAASDLQFALPDLAVQYEKQTGVKLAITYGSSGNFFAQIQNGAPFDIFLSADVSYPHKLVVAQLADVSSVQIYAVGHLVLWLPPDSPLDPSAGLKILLDSRIQKIAIANPEHAPYGRAAVAVLRAAGVYDQIKPKLVFGENIAQAAQFVQTGSVQAGLLSHSLTFSPAMKSGKVWTIPADQYPPVEQAAVLLTASPNKDAAISFLAFLKTPAARTILERYGFFLPPPAAATKHKL
jgi:molybdate transport system substrate-binding protein